MTHKDFMGEMVCQLSGVPRSRRAGHIPALIVRETGKNSNKGRQNRKHCLQVDTAWKCQSCDAAPHRQLEKVAFYSVLPTSEHDFDLIVCSAEKNCFWKDNK